MWVCVCVCAWVCFQTPMEHLCVHMKEPEVKLSYPSLSLSPWFLEAGSPTEPGVHQSWLCLWSPRVCLSQPPQFWGYRHMLPCLSFYCRCWRFKIKSSYLYSSWFIDFSPTPYFSKQCQPFFFKLSFFLFPFFVMGLPMYMNICLMCRSVHGKGAHTHVHVGGCGAQVWCSNHPQLFLQILH